MLDPTTLDFSICQNQVPSYIFLTELPKKHLNGTNKDILELRRQLASYFDFQKWSPILGYTLLETT